MQRVYPIEKCDVSGVKHINTIEQVVENAGMSRSIFGSPVSQHVVFGQDASGRVLDPVSFIVKAVPSEEPNMVEYIQVTFPMSEAMDLDCETWEDEEEISALLSEVYECARDYMFDSGFPEIGMTIYKLR